MEKKAQERACFGPILSAGGANVAALKISSTPSPVKEEHSKTGSWYFIPSFCAVSRETNDRPIFSFESKVQLIFLFLIEKKGKT